LTYAISLKFLYNSGAKPPGSSPASKWGSGEGLINSDICIFDEVQYLWKSVILEKKN